MALVRGSSYNISMIVLLIITLILLIAVSGTRPNKCAYSEFEMRRRSEKHGRDDMLNWRRYEYYHDVHTLRRIIVTFLLVCVSVLFVVTDGWLVGLLLGLITALLYMRIALLGPVKRLCQRIYDSFEPNILQATEHMSRGLRVIGGSIEPDLEYVVSSRQELLHLVETAGALLSKNEAKLIKSGLEFEGKQVKNYMTPRSVMEAIGCNELLGPLTLDNLHQTGHTHFPVMDGDIDHLVGILHIYSLFTLENKKSLVVKDVMEPRVFYIHEEQTLEDVLAACIKYRRHLLVVVNEYRETVGIITIEDAIIQLTGRKIIDQFAEHDNLRAVAARNPRENNQPQNHTDV